MQEALCHRHAEITNGDRFLFPNLETLALDFSYETESLEGEYDLFTDLVDLVRARHELGVPLRETVIPSETSDWAEWNGLRAAVSITLLK